MARFKLSQKPAAKKPNLQAMRRVLIETMWSDYKLFGHTTEAVKAARAKIIKAKTRAV
jgi:hypothetical protein